MNNKNNEVSTIINGQIIEIDWRNIKFTNRLKIGLSIIFYGRISIKFKKININLINGDLNESNLNYCKKCIQMTNWENGECAKCKISKIINGDKSVQKGCGEVIRIKSGCQHTRCCTGNLCNKCKGEQK